MRPKRAVGLNYLEFPDGCALGAMAKKVRGSHRGDLTTVRNCAIVRSVAIALLKQSV
jgi:hypothetical protein